MPQLQNALSHVSLGTNQFEQAIAFYDAVLAPLGIRRVHDLSEHRAIAYGRAFPELWIQAPHDGQPAQTANGVHIAFLAENNAQVDAFYAAALAHRTTATPTMAASFAIWTGIKSKQWLGTNRFGGERGYLKFSGSLFSPRQ